MGSCPEHIELSCTPDDAGLPQGPITLLAVASAHLSLPCAPPLRQRGARQPEPHVSAQSAAIYLLVVQCAGSWPSSAVRAGKPSPIRAKHRRVAGARARADVQLLPTVLLPPPHDGVQGVSRVPQGDGHVVIRQHVVAGLNEAPSV